ARPVDDPEPQDGEVEGVAPRLERQSNLAVDLRQMREIARVSERSPRPDLAGQIAPVDLQRGGEDEQRHARLADGAADPAGPADVRLLGVVRLPLGQRT